MTRLSPFLLVCSVLIFASSCKTTKSTVLPVIDRSKAEIVKAIYQHNYNFEWLVAEGSMKVESPLQNAKTKLYLRMKKDSIIWSVVKKVGVEGGRLLINPDMYAAVNRLDGTYTRGSTESALSQFGLSYDFTDIQQALFGNIILPDTQSISIIQSPSGYHVTSPRSDELSYVIDPSSLQVISARLKEDNGAIIDISFADYKPVDKLATLAHKRTIVISDGTVVTTISLDFSKIMLDTPKSTKFTIPPHYEEIPSIF